ncbi:MAG: DUF4256 domain-containing protein [Gemmatimonadales bacterium]
MPAKMSATEKARVLETLKTRFEAHPERHPGIDWEPVAQRLEADAGKCRSVGEMERTGGEPDVVGYDPDADQYLVVDCSAETPKDRRSLCYDRAALEARKEHQPRGSAVEQASAMGIELLTEAAYRQLQELGEFDTKTSSWVATPADVRKLGGALFCDRRYGKVFLYHNGAQSYYAARGFRGVLRL